jgi:Hemerythrin HHE cation binding domain
MNAISMLKNDHRKVEKLFRDFETAGDRAFRKRQEIARKVCTEIEIHGQLEEQLFYPAVQMTADAKGQHSVRAAVKEHHVVQTIIDKLNVMSSEAENYGPTFKMLAEHVEHHIRAEERDMLPGGRDQLGQDGLEYLGDQMVRRRRELTPAHPPSAARHPTPGQGLRHHGIRRADGRRVRQAARAAQRQVGAQTPHPEPETGSSRNGEAALVACGCPTEKAFGTRLTGGDNED